MRGRVRSTLVLLAVLTALAAYIYHAELSAPAPFETGARSPKALTLKPEAIEQVAIKSAGGDVTTIAKAGESWQITSPIESDADGAAMISITRSVNTLEITRVVDENPTDLEQYGLDPPRVEVTLKASGDPDVHRLLIGNTTTTGGNLYAQLAPDNAVVLIPASFDETFNRTTWDLRDKRVLKFDRVEMDSLALVTPRHRVRFSKRDLEWDMTEPLQTEGDLGVISDLVTKLATAEMLAIAATAPPDLARYGLDKPRYVVTAAKGGSRATLHVGGRADDSTIYARDLSRHFVFTIDRSFIDALDKEPWEFRRKELFAFQTFNARRLELTRQGQTTIYERAEDREGETEQNWRELSPNERDIEASKMETALSRLSFLRAVAFVPNTKQTGLESPDISARVTYEDSDGQRNEERVTFAETGTEPYATRTAWPDAARLDSTAYGLLVEALDDLKK